MNYKPDLISAMQKCLLLFFGLLALMPFAKAEDMPIHAFDFQIYLWPQSVSAEVLQNLGEGDLLPSAQPPLLYYQASPQAGLTRIEAGYGELSSVWRFEGAGPLVFFRDLPPEGESWDQYVIARYYPVGEDERVALFLFPESEGREQLSVLPIGNGPSRIPQGKSLVKNLTSDSLAAQIGNDKFILEPQQEKTVNISSISDYNLPFRLAVGISGEDWKIRHSETKIIDPNDSLLFLIYQREHTTGRYRILSLKNVHTHE